VNRTQGSAVSPEEAVAAAGLVAAETACRFQLAREMVQPGCARAGAGMAGRWSRGAGPGLAYPGLEERRRGPGGRAHVADPGPGDFPGRVPDPGQNPEPELEAG
jgi:hypothetical protein